MNQAYLQFKKVSQTVKTCIMKKATLIDSGSFLYIHLIRKLNSMATFPFWSKYCTTETNEQATPNLSFS